MNPTVIRKSSLGRRVSRKLSFSQASTPAPVTSTVLFAATKKNRRSRKSKTLKVHRSSIYYVESEPNSRKAILEKFLDFLLDDKILSREPIIRRIEEGKDGSISSMISEYSDFSDYREPRSSNEYTTIINTDGSKSTVDRSTGRLVREPRKSDVMSGSIYGKSDTTMTCKVSNSLEVIKSVADSCDMSMFIKIEKIHFDNGNMYEGPTNECLMDGVGRFMWADKSVYQGEFKDGYISGKGEILLSNQSKYEGDFCNGFFHGKGFLNVVSTPQYYYGEWKNGKKHGNGWLMYEPGDWYEGEWKDDQRNGLGYRRYKNGAKYKGDWVNDKKQGNGQMLYHNDDYYTGEWHDDKLQGYGEYTWDIIFNKSFIYPQYNWYRGSWVNDKRDGIGTMNFGTESGAKYAGTWRRNFKHGPGVMICGNGLMLESNPLFLFNKPIHKAAQITFAQLCAKYPDKNLRDLITGGVSYYKIRRLVYSEVPQSKLDDEIIANITYNSGKIPQHMFMKLGDMALTGKKMWCPLYIPTHTVAEDVDLKYFVDLLFNCTLKDIPTQQCTAYFDTLFKVSEKGYQRQTAVMAKYSIGIGGEPTESASDLSTAEERIKFGEEKEVKRLRKTIVIYLYKLKYIYNKYASIGRIVEGDSKLNFMPMMVRLHLWMFLRDLQLSDDGIQLIDLDLLIFKNDRSGVSTKHHPFEPLYFYHFVMYLMGAACMGYLAKLDTLDVREKLMTQENCEELLPSKIFRDFLDAKLQSIEMLKGSALLDHLNSSSLQSLYELYASIGDPVSIKALINATYRKEDEAPPCYCAVSTNPKYVVDYSDGFNAIPLAHEIHFVREPQVRHVEPTDVVHRHDDEFYRSLYTFRTLGKKTIEECIVKVCPLAMAKKGLSKKYKITFLEFFEIVVLLAHAKAEEEIKKCIIMSCRPATTSETSYKIRQSRKKRAK